MNSLLVRKNYTLLVFVLMIFFSSNSYATFDNSFGIGLDIIQGKNQLEYWATGNNCGESQIFVYDENGIQVLSSPVFDETEFTWLIDMTNLGSGTYNVVAQSENCTMAETIEI